MKNGPYLAELNIYLSSDATVLLLDIYPGEMKTLCPQNDTEKNAQGIFIHSSQKLETQMITSRKRHILVHSYNGILLSFEKEQIIYKCNNMGVSQNIMLSKGSQAENNTYCMTALIISSKTSKINLH